MPLKIPLLALLFCCLSFNLSSAHLKYDLDLQVDPLNRKITGLARLTANEDCDISLSLHGLSGVKLENNLLPSQTDDLNLRMQKNQAYVITYEALFSATQHNFIDDEHLFLTGNWYPRPNHLSQYRLAVTLPEGFLAVSEADTTTISEREGARRFEFRFDHPLEALTLAASKRYVLKKATYNQIAIEAYFFKEDAHMADAYIEHTKKYLAMYEVLLTPYPYKRFAIVENLFPTGFSLPTYTLLGKAVVRLPFITKTSLGHEILHQWFGNSVYVDPGHGNWAEGLTTYLADHHYMALEGRGADYRKQIMIDHAAYVHEANALAVSDFIHQSGRAAKAVGYGMCAMVFHQLRKTFGEAHFFGSLREFIKDNAFREASWHDIQSAFEKTTGTRLFTRFAQYLERKDVPELTIENAHLVVVQGRLTLFFDLIQSEKPYELTLPVTIHTPRGRVRRLITVSKHRETIRLILEDLPARVVIDEEYDLMRKLTTSELPPVLASVMGAETLLAVIPAGDRRRYQPVIDALGAAKVRVVSPAALSYEQLKDHSVLIAGFDTPAAEMLFGKAPQPEDGVRLQVQKNPYSPVHTVTRLHVKNREEARAISRTLSHYGKYSRLAFTGGKNTLRGQAGSENGMTALSRPESRVLEPGKMATLVEIIPRLKEKRVVYVGEQHKQFAHHMNQLAVIKMLHESGLKLAVGMEMFQIPYQKALDDYLAGRIDERRFLKDSAYFDKWRYDYNLYKPIIDYLKQNEIPLIALNIEGDISRKVSRSGLHGLTDSERKHLPSGMDFSNEKYRNDLRNVFLMHQGRHGIDSFDFFVQSQTLWDETMAESIHRFLLQNPDARMVVLAGNGHLTYKYGIPNRVYRRNRETYTVIVQDEANHHGIADYVLTTHPLAGKKAPMLGVVIEEKADTVHVVSISDDTPAKKAGMESGDIIVSLAGEAVTSLFDLRYILFYTEMDRTVPIQVLRKQKELTLDITLFDF